MDVLESGRDMKQRERVLHRIARCGQHTLVDIQKSIGSIKMSSVAGRVSELLNEGMIKETQRGWFIAVTSLHEAQHLSKLRSDARYRKWVKLGTDQGYFQKHAKDFFQYD